MLRGPAKIPCGRGGRADNHVFEMGHRLRILAVILVPLALVAGAYLIGVDAPGQALGRNYVVRIALPEAGRPVGLPPVEGPDDTFIKALRRHAPPSP